MSKSQKIFLFSFHLQKRKININLLQVILWKTTLYLIFSNTYTYVFANGNDNPIFKPKPKNHSVDNNMFQVHRKFFNLKFWKEWVKTKDSFWDLAFFMQSMLHFPAWAVTKFWHLCQLRAASLSRSLLLLVATIYSPIKELRIHSIYLPTYYLIVFKVCPAHKIFFHG